MFEFEIYIKNNKKMVYLSNDGSSGCKYSFETKEDLKRIVSDYIDDNYDENNYLETETETDNQKDKLIIINPRYSLTYFDKVGSRCLTENFKTKEEAYEQYNKLVEAYEHDGTENSGLELYDNETDETLESWENPEDIDDGYDDGDCNCNEEYEEVDLDVAERIAKDYGVSIDTVAGLSLRDIEEELGEEEGALDRYLLDEEDE